MTPAQRNAEAVQGFIQSQVVITIPGHQSICLPPVVGRSLAGGIATLVKTEFPHASISIQGRCRDSLAGLDDALRMSDEVHTTFVECQRQLRPGAALVEHFKAAAQVGGAQ
ncbi:hypothetical protein [Pseudomonas sp.]|uniref:hypothetical protein n=1 Tax=Pseudomonas sp. TaxID=306 RepID=UPI003D127B2D